MDKEVQKPLRNNNNKKRILIITGCALCYSQGML